MRETQTIGTSTEAERMRAESGKGEKIEIERGEWREITEAIGDPEKMEGVLSKMGVSEYWRKLTKSYEKEGLSRGEAAERGADVVEASVAAVVERGTEDFKNRGPQIIGEITKSAERIGVDPEVIKAVVGAALDTQKRLEIELAAERDRVIITIRPERAPEAPKPEAVPGVRPEAPAERPAEAPAEAKPEISTEAEIRKIEIRLEDLAVEREKLLLEKKELQQIDFEKVSGPERDRVVTRLWDEIPKRLMEIAMEELDLRARLIGLREKAKTRPGGVPPEAPEKPPEAPKEVPSEVPEAPPEVPPEVPPEKPLEVPPEAPKEVPEVPKTEVPPEKPPEVPEEKAEAVPEITPEEAEAAAKETEAAAAKVKEFAEEAVRRLKEIEEKMAEKPAKKKEMMKAMKEKAKAVGERIKNGLKKGVEKVGAFFRKIFEAGKGFLGKVPEKAASIGKAVKSGFKTAVGFLKKLFFRG